MLETKQKNSYDLDPIIINEKDGARHNQLLTYNVINRIQLSYQENDWNGEILNICQNPQLLIHYFKDTFSKKRD